MTSTRPGIVARVCGQPSDARSSATRSSRICTRVSQQRGGWSQIQSQTIEDELSRGMIVSMPSLSSPARIDRSSDTTGYTSAHRSAYTVTDTTAKEVP